jgi:hypothetical protein
MQGEPRAGAKRVTCVFNAQVLREFDALVRPQQRSRQLENFMKAQVLKAKLGEQVSEGALAEVLALID